MDCRMGKRFTETNKWSDPWFRALSLEHKAAWAYLTDNCDAAGVIDLDVELANFQIKAVVDWKAFEEAAGDRLRRTQKGKLWLTGFVQFQCGDLSEESKPHKSVISLLKKHGLWEGYAKGIQTLKEKDKEKEKDNRGGAGGDSQFAEWWSTVPNKTGKQAAAKAYRKAVSAISGRAPSEGPGGDDPHGFLLDRMTAFAASPKARGDFCPHPATWLGEGRYDDDPSTWMTSGNASQATRRGPELDPQRAQKWRP